MSLTMIAFLLPLLLNVTGGVHPPQELFPDGKLDSVGSWTVFPHDATAEHTTELGAAAKGCLYLSNDVAGSDKLKMWIHAIDFDAGSYERLRLSCQVRTANMGPDTRCQLMGQVIVGGDTPKAVTYPRTRYFTESCEWTATDAVFDVDPGATRLRLLFFMNGPGEAWLDDVSVTETTDPVTPPPKAPAVSASSQEGPFEALARGAGLEIPWLFDGPSAKAQASASRRPILAYVRCTDAEGGVESMGSSLEAPAVPLLEDGMLKDVVFRAGPISTPRIAEYVTEHFVPVCLAYGLAQNNRGPSGPRPEGWGTQPSIEGVSTRFDATLGHDEPGSLRIERTAGEGLSSWFQMIDWNGDGAQLELEAAMRVSNLPSGQEANVMVQCWKGDKAIAFGRLEPLKENADWSLRAATFEVPEGTERINLIAYLTGLGVAHFDDLVIRQDDASPNLLRNGGLAATPPRGLGDMPIMPHRITTPALVVIGQHGEAVATLDRIGALSDEFIGEWLRAALQLAREDGKAPKLGRPHPKVRGALKAASEGRWEKALELSDRAIRVAGEEAQFLKGLCLKRLGQHAAATEVWTELASESPWGRKAAACLLPKGPRLHEALTLRPLPFGDVLPTNTETPDLEFSPTRSLFALIELQRADGSFGSHTGALGKGWNDGAITALAVDALRTWEPRVPRAAANRMKAAADRSVAFLKAYAESSPRASERIAAFVNPYVLRTLLREGQGVASQEMVAHIQATQDPDGNWSVYGEHRPASFNTAQNVIALLEAKEAGIEVKPQALEQALDALAAMMTGDALFPYSTATGHDWMTTTHGSIGRDPLCEHALLLGARGSKERLNEALARYIRSGEELRAPTKRLYDYFNSRGHGGYFFFFAHRRALEAATAFASEPIRKRTQSFVLSETLKAQEGDGTFIDHYNMGRAYGTAQALLLLAHAGWQ